MTLETKKSIDDKLEQWTVDYFHIDGSGPENRVVHDTKKIALSASYYDAAKKFISKGDELLLEHDLEKARKYASITEQDISLEVAEIEERGYLNLTFIQLLGAQYYAMEGDSVRMEICIKDGKKWAEKIGQDIFQKVAEIEERGYQKAVSVGLIEARARAESKGAPKR